VGWDEPVRDPPLPLHKQSLPHSGRSPKACQGTNQSDWNSKKQLGAASRKLQEKAGGELKPRMLAQSFRAIAGRLTGWAEIFGN